ncbi:MAG: peptidylprolyl isomerase [Myxococcota bacterium]
MIAALLQGGGCATTTSTANSNAGSIKNSSDTIKEVPITPGFAATTPSTQRGQLLDFIAARVQFSPDSEVEVILWEQLRERARLTNTTWQKARNDWIDEVLMQGALSIYGQQVTQQIVQLTIDRMQQQSGLSPEKFIEALLQMKGFTPQQHRNWVKHQMIRARYAQYVSSQGRVSDQQLQGALRLRSLRIPTQNNQESLKRSQDQAQNVVDKVNALQEPNAKIERFQQLAEQFCSQQPHALLTSSQKVNPALLLKEFKEAVSEAAAGKVVGPVYSNGSWHVILVEERCPITASMEWQVGDTQKEVDTMVQRELAKLRRIAFIHTYNPS